MQAQEPEIREPQLSLLYFYQPRPIRIHIKHSECRGEDNPGSEPLWNRLGGEGANPFISSTPLQRGLQRWQRCPKLGLVSRDRKKMQEGNWLQKNTTPFLPGLAFCTHAHMCTGMHTHAHACTAAAKQLLKQINPKIKVRKKRSPGRLKWGSCLFVFELSQSLS